MAFSRRRLLYSPFYDPYNEPPPSPPLAPPPLASPSPISQPPSPLTNNPLPLGPPKHRAFLGHIPLIGFVIGAFLLFSIVFMAVSRYLIKRRESRQRIRRNPTNPRDGPILFDTQEGFRFLDEEQGPQLDHPIWYIRTVGLDQSVIDSIALFKYKKGEGVIDGTDCSVCLTEFDEDETLRLLPKCSHAFHVPCVDTWLRSHQNCPLCRAPIIRAISEAANSNPGESSTETLIAPVRVIEVREEAESRGSGSSSNSENSETRVLIGTGEGDEIELQGLRRSVSMDAASASEVYRAVGIGTSGKGMNLDSNSESRVIGVSSRLYRVMMKSCSFGSSHKEYPPLKRSSSSK